jgi:hypothetical protein
VNQATCLPTSNGGLAQGFEEEGFAGAGWFADHQVCGGWHRDFLAARCGPQDRVDRGDAEVRDPNGGIGDFLP